MEAGGNSKERKIKKEVECKEVSIRASMIKIPKSLQQKTLSIEVNRDFSLLLGGGLLGSLLGGGLLGGLLHLLGGGLLGLGGLLGSFLGGGLLDGLLGCSAS